MKKRIIITAAVFGALATIAGAFGAHGLDGVISPKNLQVWNTAVQYQFYHVAALGILSTLTRYRIKIVRHSYYLFMAGTILFCGSLYLLACDKQIEISLAAIRYGADNAYWRPCVLLPAGSLWG